MKKILTLAITAAALTACQPGTFTIQGAGEGSVTETTHHDVHWAYEGATGPEHWASLSDEFLTCGTGVNQSPIDIQVSKAIEANLQPLALNYIKQDATVVNNGHTIQMNYAAGQTLTIEGNDFELLQVHFHTPSENLVDGQTYPLEAHFVHKSAAGKLAVIGVMFAATPTSQANAALETIWSVMPEDQTHTGSVALALATDLMPASKAYYRFDGSLTTPPCSEGVTWIVLKDALTASEDQVARFSHMVHGHNARPAQPINARTVLK